MPINLADSFFLLHINGGRNASQLYYFLMVPVLNLSSPEREKTETGNPCHFFFSLASQFLVLVVLYCMAFFRGSLSSQWCLFKAVKPILTQWGLSSHWCIVRFVGGGERVGSWDAERAGPKLRPGGVRTKRLSKEWTR